MLHALPLPRRPEPNPAPGRSTHRWDGVLSPRSILDLSTACPTTPRSASVVTAYLSDRPNWPTFPSKQDCEPRPQAHLCRPAYPSVVQATASRSGDAEHCCCWCGAGVTDDKWNSRAGNRRTQRSCDRRTPHGSKKTGFQPEKLVPRQVCPNYARTARGAPGTLAVSA